MATLVLGIDVGTTSTKVVLADPAAGVVAQASEPVALSSPHPGWAEADPAQWWANLAALVPAVLAAASAAMGRPVTAADIAAVATRAWFPPSSRSMRRGVRCAVHPPERRSCHGGDPRTGRRAARPGFRRAHRLGAYPAVGQPDAAVAGQARAGRLGVRRHRARLLRLARHQARRGAARGAELGTGKRPVRARPERHADAAAPGAGRAGEPSGDQAQVVPPVADPGTVIGEVSRTAAAETGLRPGTRSSRAARTTCCPRTPRASPAPATGWSSSAARATSSSSAATRSSTRRFTWTPTR